MNWQDILKKIAPTVVSATLGPMGTVAYEAISSILGVPQDKVESAIASGKLTPEQVTKLKELELKYQADEAERGFRYAELEFKNVQGARDMQVATRSPVPAVLTYLLTFGFFGVLGMMFYAPELKESAPLMIMLGSLGTAWTSACAFWFGTTSSSREKTAMLAAAQPVKS